MTRETERACILVSDGHLLGSWVGGERHMLAPTDALWDTPGGNAG